MVTRVDYSTVQGMHGPVQDVAGLEKVFKVAQYATTMVDAATLAAANAGHRDDAIEQAFKQGAELARHELAEAVADLPEGSEGSVRVRGSSWQPVDLDAVVDGLVDGTLRPPEPDVGQVEGAGRLFYAGKVNGIAGESGAGKSWAGLLVAAQELAIGNAVVYLDLEDGAAGVVGRLLAIGAEPEAIRRRFCYVSPDEPSDAVVRELVGAVLLDVKPSLVVVDSTGEALSLQGANPNADEEVARWFRQVPRLLASTGAAVVVVDHTAKAADGGLWPIGSQRKRAAINGVQYMVELVRPFSRDVAGHAVLRCGKDRHGAYRAGQRVAELHVVPTGRDGVDVSLRPVEDSTTSAGQFRPTVLMERVSEALELAGEPLSFKGICDLATGKRQHLQTAVAALVSEGHVTRSSGPRGTTFHTLVSPFSPSGSPEPGTAHPQLPQEPASTGSRFLEEEPGTGRLSGSGNRSGTAGNRSDSEANCDTCGADLDRAALLAEASTCTSCELREVAG